MNWITQNWFNVVGVAIIAIGAVIGIKKYLDQDKEKKIATIVEWLKYGVTITEDALGSGTGQLKLRMLYSMATAQFPFIVKILSFEQFSDMVDDALEWMREQIETNPNIKFAILGETKEAK